MDRNAQTTNITKHSCMRLNENTLTVNHTLLLPAYMVICCYHSFLIFFFLYVDHLRAAAAAGVEALGEMTHLPQARCGF